MKIRGRPKEAREDLIRISVIFIICLFGSFSFVLGQTPDPALQTGPGKPVNVSKVREFVLHYKTEDESKFTYAQLKQWFESKAAAYKFLPFDYPRLFPFCVTRNQIIQGHSKIRDQSDANMKRPLRVPEKSHLFKFERIFHSIELRRKRYYQFEPNEDSMVQNQTFVKAITFHRINTPEPDMVNLRQWVHIKVQMAEKMMGLYLQAIVGPFGLPFGEFSVEFPCSDDTTNTADIDKVGQLAYCSYRPRTNIYHPSVYVGVDEKQRTEFHVHFKWFDLACMETPYVQFLIVAVKNFTLNPKYGKDFVAQLSAVFLNTDFDSKDGSPYPYYPDFRNNMFCFLKSQAELQNAYRARGIWLSSKGGADKSYDTQKWVVAKDVGRVQPNEEYDDCILYDSGVKTTKNVAHIKQNETTYECGPGPLRCDKDYSKLAQNNKITQFRTDLVSNETKVDKCIPCGVPECVAVGFNPEYCNIELPEIQDLSKQTNILTNLDDNFRIRNHGVGGMLSFLFLIPVGNIVGRFYKEILGKCLFGNGPWISMHIVCCLLSLAAIWSSMGPMIPKLAAYRFRLKECKNITNSTGGPGYDECMKGYVVDTAHNIIGMIAYILVHFVPIFGFIRPASKKMRYLMSSIHSYLGYFTYILGVVAVYLVINDNCIDTLVFASIMISLPIICSIVLVVLDGMSDKLIGVNPPRRKFPVLEQLQLESIGPLSFVKLIVLAVFIGLMTITWLLALLSLHIVAGSGDALIDGAQSLKGKKGKFLKGLQGIFGTCK